MVDNFNDRITTSNNLLKSILSDIKKRQNLIKDNQATILIEASIRGDMIKLDNNINYFKTTINSYKASPQGMSLQEINRRNKQTQEVYNNYLILKKDYEKSVLSSLNNDNKYEEDERKAEEKYNQLQEVDAIIDFKEQIKEQDEGLGMLHGILKNNRNLNRKMNEEVDVQKNHLGEMDGLMENVKFKVKNTNNKLDEYSKKSSNWFLMLIILLELIVLVLVIFIL